MIPMAKDTWVEVGPGMHCPSANSSPYTSLLIQLNFSTRRCKKATTAAETAAERVVVGQVLAVVGGRVLGEPLRVTVSPVRHGCCCTCGMPHMWGSSTTKHRCHCCLWNTKLAVQGKVGELCAAQVHGCFSAHRGSRVEGSSHSF
jgi:hypothetical protein